MNVPSVFLDGTARVGRDVLFGPIQLELRPGCWTGLLGASGAGKTTLLRLVAGLETEIAFDGQVAAADGAALAPRLAYMGQGDLLLPWADVRSNITLGARLRGRRADLERADELIARVGLAAHARKRPRALSGGQRQRAALARTLMEDREIVLLDEPFSALDARTRAEMQDLAGELLAGRTVLLVTHDPLEAVRLSHQAFLLSEGRLHPLPLPSDTPVRAIDAPATLSAQAEMFRRLRA